jgi:hypothetical protein
MTASGERGIICQMQIESESQEYLSHFSTSKARALKKALDPLLEEPPKSQFILSWNEQKHLWQSRIEYHSNRSSSINNYSNE